jgi:hypothetical protein
MWFLNFIIINWKDIFILINEKKNIPTFNTSKPIYVSLSSIVYFTMFLPESFYSLFQNNN